MKPRDVHIRRVGMRWGRACERITAAREAMFAVLAIKDLLPKRVYERAKIIADDVASLELALWCEEDSAARGDK